MSVEQACSAADAECGFVFDGCDGQVDCNALLEHGRCEAFLDCNGSNSCVGATRDTTIDCSNTGFPVGTHKGFGYVMSGSTTPSITDFDGEVCRDTGDIDPMDGLDFCCNVNLNYCFVSRVSDDQECPNSGMTAGKPFFYECDGGPGTPKPDPSCQSRGAGMFCCSSPDFE